MRLSQVTLTELDVTDRLVSAATPLILEIEEGRQLAADFFELYRTMVNPAAVRLRPATREANADTFPIDCGGSSPTLFHVVYDIDATHFGIEAGSTAEAEKVFRLLREQRLLAPDIEYIRQHVHGGLAVTTAALLWQVGAIRVSLGDLRPLFRVDERKNVSPIYVDVKSLPDYPLVNDFIVSQAALLAGELAFDHVCGIEAGSISLATLLAGKLGRPSFFARREKRYPEAPLLEGVKEHELFRRRVLLVDDTLVKGWTKLRVIDGLEHRGCRVVGCLVIFDRAQGGRESLEARGIAFHALTDRVAALSKEIPAEITFLTDQEYEEVNAYFADPRAWHERHGLVYHELAPHS